MNYEIETLNRGEMVGSISGPVMEWSVQNGDTYSIQYLVQKSNTSQTIQFPAANSSSY
jgi:hypothetical protein